MTVIALTSTRSSPGVSSLAVALALVWQRQGREPLLVEADPAGGVLGLRFDLAAEPSLATLAADLRRGYETDRFTKNSVDVLGVRSLLAPVDPLTASRVLQRNGETLAAAIRSHGRPTVVDLGRLDSHSPSLPLAAAADRVLVVARPRVEDVQSLLFGCRLLRGHRAATSLVTIGDRPYAPTEVARFAGLPLSAVIPDDRELAVAFSGGRFSGRRLRRSLLWRSVQALATALVTAEPPLPRGATSGPPTPSAPPALAGVGVGAVSVPPPQPANRRVPAVEPMAVTELIGWRARPRGAAS